MSYILGLGDAGCTHCNVCNDGGPCEPPKPYLTGAGSSSGNRFQVVQSTAWSAGFSYANNDGNVTFAALVSAPTGLALTGAGNATVAGNTSVAVGNYQGTVNVSNLCGTNTVNVFYTVLTAASVCPNISSVSTSSRSASVSKCGFSEFGTPSSPPRKYLARGQSGTITEVDGGPADGSSNTWGGSESYSVSGGVCTYEDDRTRAVFDAICGCGYTISGGAFSGITSAPGAYLSVFAAARSGCVCDPSNPGGSAVTFASPNSYSATSASWSGVAGSFSGTVTQTLSVEYTTSMLSSQVYGVVSTVSWSSCSAGTTAFDDLSSDQLTESIREVQYVVNFASAAAAGCKLLYDLYNGDGSVNTLDNCISLSTGATSYTFVLNGGGSVGYYATNFRTGGSC